MNFKVEQEKVMKALALLDSEKADAIIDEAPEVYKTLVQGMDGAHGMMFLMAVNSGMKNTPQTREMSGQGKLAMLTLVHYAFALGIEEGRRRS